MGQSSELAHIRAIRRARLNELLETISAAELERRTGIDAAYIYQMAKGKGRNKRGISDITAAKIERAAKRDPGWMSQAEAAQIAEDPARYATGLDREMLRGAILYVLREVEPGTSPERIADAVLMAYDLLQLHAAEQVVARAINGMLSGLTDSKITR